MRVSRPPLRSERVESNFYQDLRLQMQVQLRKEGYIVPDASEDTDVVLKWVTVRLRHIPRKPRRTVWSEELRRRCLDPETRRTVKKLSAASECGKNMNPHLSRRYLTASFNDLLHNDWRIHHMHLGPRGGKKTGRTGELLFTLASDDALYLLDVLDHKAFGDVRLVEIIYRNFPHVMPLMLTEILPSLSGEPLSKEERVKAREGGVQPFVEIHGKVFVSMGGITTSGDNRQAVTNMDMILHQVNAIEEGFHREPQRAWAALGRSDAPPDLLKLKLLLGGTRLSLVEATTMARAELGVIRFRPQFG